MTAAEAIDLAQQWESPSARPEGLTSAEQKQVFATVAALLRQAKMTVPLWLGGDALFVEPLEDTATAES